MATLCTNCGTALPRDDAKFCNNCGTLVPSHPFSPRSTATAPQGFQGAEKTRMESSRPPLREHIAHIPPSPVRPPRRFTQDEPPTWMTRLDDAPGKQSSELSSNQTVMPQLDFPAAEPGVRPNNAARELRVKVWQSEDPLSSLASPSSPEMVKESSQPTIEDDVDAFPTSPLAASSHNSPVQQSSPLSPQLSATAQNDYLDELERADTAHLASSFQASPAQARKQFSNPGFNQSFAAPWQRPAPMHEATTAMATHSETAAPPRPVSRPAPPVSAPVAHVTSERQLKQTPLPPVATPPLDMPRKKGRKPVVLIVGLLAILLIGATGIWVAIAQPFTIPIISQPQQSFTNSQLAFALQYPRGWVARVNTSTSTIVFADSSNTAQVTVSATTANGSDAGQAARQLASQAKMTGIKTGATQTFGGATWQQVQGNVSLSGANYLETILATVHNNRLYTIVQVAPASTYGQEEQMAFSPLRSSFQFL